MADESYAGERCGVVTPEARGAIRVVAETEGTILDPVHSGKAALIDPVGWDRIGTAEAVVFVRTGGTSGLFARANELINA